MLTHSSPPPPLSVRRGGLRTYVLTYARLLSHVFRQTPLGGSVGRGSGYGFGGGSWGKRARVMEAVEVLALGLSGQFPDWKSLINPLYVVISSRAGPAVEPSGCSGLRVQRFLGSSGSSYLAGFGCSGLRARREARILRVGFVLAEAAGVGCSGLRARRAARNFRLVSL